MSAGWLTGTLTVRLPEYLGLLAWACVASAVAADRWWEHRCLLRVIAANAEPTGWDNDPPADAQAELDYDAERETA